MRPLRPELAGHFAFPKYLAFDIETSGLEHPEILCAATLAFDEARPSVWGGAGEGDGQMDEKLVGEFVDALESYVGSGYTLLSWNGLAFDFRVLAEASGRRYTCAELALEHIDMMFYVVCRRGHYLGLDKAAKGMGLAGKPAGVSGADVQSLWAAGERKKVLEYVAQDVRTLMELAKAVDFCGELRWLSSSGKEIVLEVERWLTVKEALRLPLPNTSWMSDPPKRESFIEWTQEVIYA